MLANNNEFFLYGGLIRLSDASNNAPPDGDDVLSYQLYSYNIEGQVFRPGPVHVKLPSNLTRYVTYGGAANAPSENKAFYFGGSRAPDWGPIYQVSANTSLNPIAVSNDLVTLDIGENDKVWHNQTLPSNIPSRANPSMVWVPVGNQGILVVLGGVSFPAYSTPDEESSNEAQSEKDSPGYMANIDIYDVASNEWYQQHTVGAPPQLAMGCAVVATAKDLSSYNIYYYGGFNGLSDLEDFNDDVWVLSLPSFTWMKLAPGTPGHARAGHQCVMPYPDQMVTIGGYRASKGAGISCLEGGLFQVFNLTSGSWLQSYDPNNWSEYGVPEMLHQKIGGDFSGGATMTTPAPSGWATPALASVFATTYPASKITTFYPYSSEAAVNGTRGQPSGNSSHKGSSNARILGPVLGVVLGLVVITAIAVAIVLYRRRKLWLKKNQGDGSATQTDERTHHIRDWLSATREKGAASTTEAPSSYLEDGDSRNVTPMQFRHQSGQTVIPEETLHEMPGDHVHELMDTSPPVELNGVGLSYTEVVAKHAAKTRKPLENQVISPNSLGSSQALPATNSPGTSTTTNSPLGRGPPRAASNRRAAVNSDVSRMSEREVSHLRNLSDQTVSSASVSGAARSSLAPTPPPPGDDHGDNINNNGAYPNRPAGRSSSLRMSLFKESKGDLDDVPEQSHTQ
ncbi:hypothetical protein GGR50DRAFT_650161 [Xylaria sp. CBS 124048]|nr:hypothetical protein GGR50DRAFT_650161 [Xylaria sp. CBS 124048]